MRVVRPYARMLPIPETSGIVETQDDFTRSDGVTLLKFCEYAGRVSHRSEDKVTEDSYDKFIRSIVMNHGDFSIIEHASVTVEAVVDRGITHEWVRHRLGAYTQESTRFVNYGKKMKLSFIYPVSNIVCHWKGDHDTIYSTLAENDFIHDNGKSCSYDWQWLNSISLAEKSYQDLVKEKGVTPQIARSVLPNALASKLIVTYNLRMWRHFFLMRTSAEAHPQMREVTIPLLREFQEKIPIIYEDIIPEERQAENLKKMR